jgi:hypothetical protein
MRPIKEGDRVSVCWSSGGNKPGIVLHMPNDVGDMIYVRDDDKNIRAINPNCDAFCGLLKEEYETYQNKILLTKQQWESAVDLRKMMGVTDYDLISAKNEDGFIKMWNGVALYVFRVYDF